MTLDEKAEALMALFELSEILEMQDLTELEVVTLLLKHGYITLPDFLEKIPYDYEEI